MSPDHAEMNRISGDFRQSCGELIRLKQENTDVLPTNTANMTRFPADNEHLH